MDFLSKWGVPKDIKIPDYRDKNAENALKIHREENPEVEQENPRRQEHIRRVREDPQWKEKLRVGPAPPKRSRYVQPLHDRNVELIRRDPLAHQQRRLRQAEKLLGVEEVRENLDKYLEGSKAPEYKPSDPFQQKILKPQTDEDNERFKECVGRDLDAALWPHCLIKDGITLAEYSFLLKICVPKVTQHPSRKIDAGAVQEMVAEGLEYVKTRRRMRSLLKLPRI